MRGGSPARCVEAFSSPARCLHVHMCVCLCVRVPGGGARPQTGGEPAGCPGPAAAPAQEPVESREVTEPRRPKTLRLGDVCPQRDREPRTSGVAERVRFLSGWGPVSATKTPPKGGASALQSTEPKGDTNVRNPVPAGAAILPQSWASIKAAQVPLQQLALPDVGAELLSGETHPPGLSPPPGGLGGPASHGRRNTGPGTGCDQASGPPPGLTQPRAGLGFRDDSRCSGNSGDEPRIP